MDGHQSGKHAPVVFRRVGDSGWVGAPDHHDTVLFDGECCCLSAFVVCWFALLLEGWTETDIVFFSNW